MPFDTKFDDVVGAVNTVSLVSISPSADSIHVLLYDHKSRDHKFDTDAKPLFVLSKEGINSHMNYPKRVAFAGWSLGKRKRTPWSWLESIQLHSPCMVRRASLIWTPPKSTPLNGMGERLRGTQRRGDKNDEAIRECKVDVTFCKMKRETKSTVFTDEAIYLLLKVTNTTNEDVFVQLAQGLNFGRNGMSVGIDGFQQGRVHQSPPSRIETRPIGELYVLSATDESRKKMKMLRLKRRLQVFTVPTWSTKQCVSQVPLSFALLIVILEIFRSQKLGPF